MGACSRRLILSPSTRPLQPGGWSEVQLLNVLTGNFCMPRCEEPWYEARFEGPEGRAQVGGWGASVCVGGGGGAGVSTDMQASQSSSHVFVHSAGTIPLERLFIITIGACACS